MSACGAPEFSGEGEIGGAQSAAHAWGTYHWGRTASPFTLKTLDSVSDKWDFYLDQAISDWSQSSVIDLLELPDESRKKGTLRNCSGGDGRIRVCSDKYGPSGWLGIAGISISGSHIVTGYTKVNDSYFDTPKYDTPAWRAMVMCQELGHDFGLTHQDEDFTNPSLGTCMDYTSDPSANQHPDSHDYEQLEINYGHLDAVNTYDDSGSDGDGGGGGCNAPPGKGCNKFNANNNNPSAWGQAVGRVGRVERFVRHSGDKTEVTTVIWADGY